MKTTTLFVLLFALDPARAGEFELGLVERASVEPYRKANGIPWDLSREFNLERQAALGGGLRDNSGGTGLTWKFLWGKISQSAEKGTFFQKYQSSDVSLSGDYELVYIKNLTSQGDLIDGNTLALFALPVGTVAYTDVLNARRTIQEYDYGTKPTAAEIAELKAEADRRNKLLRQAVVAESSERAAKIETARIEREDRVLKYHQDLEAKGDAYGEFCMGKRYATGDGVATNLAKAREMFIKAAAQGHDAAAAELSKLSPK